MEKDITASFRVSQEEWEEFKKVSEKVGLNASTVLRLFIKKFNKEKDTRYLVK